MINRQRIFSSALNSVLLLTLAAAGGCADFDDEDGFEEEEEIGQTDQSLQDAMTSTGQNGFAPKYRAHNYFCLGGEDCQVGDFNGDGRDDIITFVPANGDVWAATSNGTSFVSNHRWRTGFANRNSYYDVGDFNGDGRDDIVRINRISGDVHVSYSSGSSFGWPRRIAAGLCADRSTCMVGNVNGDSYADVVKFYGSWGGASANDISVSLGRGWGLRSSVRWGGGMCSNAADCQLGDVNGDGRDDVVQITRRWNGGPVLVATSSGSSFAAATSLMHGFCTTGETCTLGDVNGSGFADLLTFQRRHNGSSFPRPDQADVMTALARYAPTAARVSFGDARIRTDRFCVADRVCRLADVNGDGRDDLVSFAQSESGAFGDVYVAKSTFGGRTNWRMDLDWMRAITVEGDADQPYLIALNFRSTFGVRGSTTISRNSFRDTSWAHGIRAGEVRAIPAWQGEHVFRNVQLPTFAELFMDSPPPLEVLGTLVIAMEHDWTPWGEVDGMVDRVERELRAALYTAVERTAPGLLILDRDGFREKMDEATTRLRGTMDVEILEAVRLTLVSGFDPEDYIDYHLYLFPAVDKEATDLLPVIPNRHVDLGVPGDGWGGYWRTTNDFIDNEDNNPMHWRVTSQMELVP